MSELRICAVVPTYRRPELLKKSLGGLLRQTRPLDKILLIDSASQDGTAEMVAREFPSVELMVLPLNEGSAGGFYHGMKWAHQKKFDWVWLVDDDACVADDSLELMLRAVADPASKLPKKSVLGPIRLWEDDETYAGLPAHQYDFSNPFLKPEGRRGARIPTSMVYPRYELLPPIVETEDLAWEGMLVPGSALDEVGYSTPGYFTQAEDTDYCLRLRKAGYRLFMVSSAKIYRLIRPQDDAPLASWKRRYIVRNRLWLNRIHAENWSTRTLRTWIWAAWFLGPSILKLRWLRDREFFNPLWLGVREGLFGELPQPRR